MDSSMGSGDSRRSGDMDGVPELPADKDGERPPPRREQRRGSTGSQASSSRRVSQGLTTAISRCFSRTTKSALEQANPRKSLEAMRRNSSEGRRSASKPSRNTDCDSSDIGGQFFQYMYVELMQTTETLRQDVEHLRPAVETVPQLNTTVSLIASHMDKLMQEQLKMKSMMMDTQHALERIGQQVARGLGGGGVGSGLGLGSDEADLHEETLDDVGQVRPIRP
eukprot:3880307-Prymnesium_polylepis.3